MKTPLTYYGGKQQLAKLIISLIPKHKLYCEPFTGGGAVFFQKPASKVEVLNDTNNELMNFYEVCQMDFTSLEKEILISLHSRDLHRKAKVIYQNPDMFDKIKRAWAVWVLSNQSFGSEIGSSFGYDRDGTNTKNITNKRESFTYDYSVRLKNVQIECADALRIIRSRDTRDSFFYCDPPYVGTDMGHYDGYTQEDFDALIAVLERIEGKFLLSSFRNKTLQESAKRNGWSSFEIRMSNSSSQMGKQKRAEKVEVLTANYPFPAGKDSPVSVDPLFASVVQ